MCVVGDLGIFSWENRGRIWKSHSEISLSEAEETPWPKVLGQRLYRGHSALLGGDEPWIGESSTER